MLFARIAAGLATVAAVSTANAALISFAADSTAGGPVFHIESDPIGGEVVVTTGATSVEIDLLINPDDGVSPTTSVRVGFEAMFTGSVGGLGPFLYDLAGSFLFRDLDTGDAILTGELESGLLILVPTPFGASGSIVAPEVDYITLPGSLLSAGNDQSVGDAGFTLTNVQQVEGEPGAYEASASFSATLIPTPGAAALLSLAGLVSTRRGR